MNLQNFEKWRHCDRLRSVQQSWDIKKDKHLFWRTVELTLFSKSLFSLCHIERKFKRIYEMNLFFLPFLYFPLKWTVFHRKMPWASYNLSFQVSCLTEIQMYHFLQDECEMILYLLTMKWMDCLNLYLNGGVDSSIMKQFLHKHYGGFNVFLTAFKQENETHII